MARRRGAGAKGEGRAPEAGRAWKRRRSATSARTLRLPRERALSRAGAALERRLAELAALPLRVRVTDNIHTMLSFGRRPGHLEVRLHRMFLDAPEEIVEALAAYIRGSDPRASSLLDRYIHQHRWMVRQVPPQVRRQRFRLRPAGAHHDLRRILRELERTLLPGPVDCAITWGTAPRPGTLPRRSIKLGSYSADAGLIRIHPALDQAEVPDYFVSWIVWHELLHHLHGVTHRHGRRCVHTEAFARDEGLHPDHERARAWERANLERLLAWDPGAPAGT